MAVNKPLGISLQGLLALVDAHGGRLAFAGLSTCTVKSLILTITGHTHTSYATQLLAAGSPYVAPATAFISHAYDDEFLGVIDSVAALEAKEGSSAFYYFDLLVVNQHSQGSVVPFEVLSNEFERSIKAIGRTLLVLRWANPTPLLRAWCVYETATTLAVKASIKVLMPPEDATAFKKALLNDFDSLTFKTCLVDVENASAREQADLDYIKRVIIEAGGFLKTNQLVIEAMKSWMVEEGRAALLSGVNESEKVALMSCLARLLSDQGKLGEAEPLCLEVLAARRRTLGNEHPDTLKSINGLVILLKSQGRLGEAEPLCIEALAARRRTLGNEHPDTLKSINNLAILLQHLGKAGEAEQLCLEALAAFRRTLGNEHPSTIASINNLASLLGDKDRLGEAEQLFLEAVAVCRRTLGSEHPATLMCINNLAILLKNQGRLGEAEPLFLESLDARRRTLGNEHPGTLMSINKLAEFLRTKGKLGEAEQLYLEAMAACRRTLGNEHPDTLDSIYDYAGLLMELGRKEEAEELYRLQLEGMRRVWGENHPSTQQSLCNYQRFVGKT